MLYIEPAFAATLLPSEQRFSHLVRLDGHVYREQNGRRTLRFEHRGKQFFLKVHTGVGWKEIFKNILQLRLPVISAGPEWRALHRLNALGIHTTKPVAYGSEGGNPARRHSFIITEDLGDTITLEEILLKSDSRPTSTAVPTPFKHALIRRVAEIARTMHENGINHRDFYLCHFRLPVAQLHTADFAQPLPIYVMDLHRAQIHHRHPRERWVAKDLACLYFSSLPLAVTQRDRFRFIRDYSGLPLRATLTSEARLWRKVERRAIRLFRKHNPA